jgi:2-(1,2-epoxy-1,2-dihydrophenyl)acetyl-CoA isomerase
VNAIYEPVDGLDASLDEAGVLRVTIDRPRTRNAMDDAMAQALIGHLVRAGQDDAVRVILLDGSGDHFCTGSDLAAKNADAGARPRVGSIQRRLPSTFHRLVPLLLETQVPVVTAVRGWAAGLGVQLALASDFCVSARSARFWQPFLARGFTPDSGATWLLPRLVGLPRARELLLLGRELSGAEAADWGLIHAAVDDEALESTVGELVRRLATGPTIAVGLTKWLLHAAASTDLDHQLANEALALELSSRSQDFKEGLAAFRDRREPRFAGR